jgi:AcrR family transcriptional regulator
MARRRGLTLDQVVDAAAAVAAVDGLDSVTLARVATALGVQSPSLYSHVDGLAGLRQALALEAARRLGAVLHDAIGDLNGAEALRAMAYAYRDFATNNPGLYASILTTPKQDDDQVVFAAFAAVLPAITAVLAQLGVAPEDAIPCIRALRSALHGFVALEASGGFGLPVDIDQSFDFLVDVVIAGVLSRTSAPRPTAQVTPAGGGAGPRSG